MFNTNLIVTPNPMMATAFKANNRSAQMGFVAQKSVSMSRAKFLASVAVLASWLMPPLANAALNVSSTAFSSSVTGSIYTQDFNSLATTGSSNTWTNDSTLPGWSLFRAPAPGTAITAYAAGDGSSTTGSFYSFGTTGSGDRALGGLGSGGAYFGSPASGAVAGWMTAAFTNNTGATINSFALKYDGEQWRNGGNSNQATQSMVLEYGFGNSFTSVSSWIPAGASFNFTSLVNTPTAGAVNGNSTGLAAGLGGAISGVTWSNGSTLWVRWIENNDAGNDHGLALDNFSLTVGNDSQITTPTSASFGRVMVNQTPAISVNLSKTGINPTSYTASPSNSGVSVLADGSIDANNQTELASVQLQNNVQGSATTGNKNYTVTVHNSATTSSATGHGSADADDSISVDATVVDNRTVSASSVDFGNVIKGSLTQVATSTLTTTGSDANFTRVTVNGVAATDGSVTVASGSNKLFDNAAATTSRNLSGSFNSAGVKSGSVVLSVTGESLAGENVNPVSIGYSANVFDPSSGAFLANGATTLDVDLGSFAPSSGVHSANEAIYNVLQTIGFTAALDFDTISGTGDTAALFTNLTNGAFTALAAGESNAFGFNVSFDTNRMPGTYNATYTLKLSDADLYTGASAPGSQSLTLNLSGTITPTAVPESAWTALVVLVLGLPVAVVCRRSIL